MFIETAQRNLEMILDPERLHRLNDMSWWNAGESKHMKPKFQNITKLNGFFFVYAFWVDH